MRITRVTTKAGDGGDTSLASGRRVPKDAARVAALGTLDELTSLLGAALAFADDEQRLALESFILEVQNDICDICADLALPVQDRRLPYEPNLAPGGVEAVERFVEERNRDLPPLEEFLLPGGSRAGALLHVARTVARRAERTLVALRRSEPVERDVVRYLNRLSDALFVAARTANRAAGIAEPIWKRRRR